MDPAQVLEASVLAQQQPMLAAMAQGESEVQRFYKNCSVFLTGGSGFLGKQLLEKLLRSCQVENVYMLIRPKKGKGVQERLKEVLEDPCFHTLRKQQPTFSEKITAIEGDVSAIKLGIKDNDWDTLTEKVDIIFHVAATTRFDEPLRAATFINVRGTREAVLLGKACTHLRSYVHVSTAYSHATTHAIGKEVKEEFYKSPIQPDSLIAMAETVEVDRLNGLTEGLIKDWPNTYTFTKAVAEELVRTSTAGLPVAIVRPAIVLSTYREPMPGWLDKSCIFGVSGLILGAGLGLLPIGLLDTKKNAGFIPCDYVNNAIIVAARETAASQERGGNDTKIYTVCSTHRNPFTYDFKYQLERQQDSSTGCHLADDDEACNSGLLANEKAVLALGGRVLKTYGLPEPRIQPITGIRECTRETDYDVYALDKFLHDNITSLTREQNNVFDKLMTSIDTNAGNLFFLDAPSGTGKTYLINLILAKVRSAKSIALAVALSGIAATLLEGGCTAHAMFKLPLNLTRCETPACNILKQILSTYRESMPGWLDKSCIFGVTGLILGAGLGLMQIANIDSEKKAGFIPCDYVNNAIIVAARENAASQERGGNDTKIYTVCSTHRNPVTYGELTYILKKFGKEIGTPKSVYYANSTYTKNVYIFAISSFFLQIIPAYVADFICVLIGKERRFVKLVNKLPRMFITLSYFTLNDWDFIDDNVTNLFRGLSKQDQDIFNFDVTDINWTEFIFVECIGIRKYILKDGLKDSEYAIKKQKYLKICL